MLQLHELYRLDFYIRNLAYGLRYANEKRLAEFGITGSQAKLLLIIHDGLETPGCDVNRKYLANVVQMKGPSVTSLLNGLEKNGFIRRASNPQDARALSIRITDRGYRLLDEIRLFIVETERQLLKGMTEEEAKVFLSLLEKVSKNIAAAGEGKLSRRHRDLHLDGGRLKLEKPSE